MSKISNFLTKGLLKGYGGKSVFKKIDRAGFPFQSSHYEENSSIYHDEWLAGELGGGQELVKSGNKMMTRLYGGGIVNLKRLKELKIKEKEIIAFLVNQIKKLGGKTRLFENCVSEEENGWKYEYKIIAKDSVIPLTIGSERIFYKDNQVFIHGFLICPFEK